jgi:hypothetical protein
MGGSFLCFLRLAAGVPAPFGRVTLSPREALQAPGEGVILAKSITKKSVS